MLHISNLPVSLQRRNAWLRAFRTCSSPMICHHLRLWTCLLACPASSKTPVTCHRPCWTISECARVMPSSVTSCSGRTLTWLDVLRQHRLSRPNVSNRLCLCVQIGTGQGGWTKRCTEGPCQPRYLPDHIRCDRAETCWSHNWSPLPAPRLCSPPAVWERCVIIVVSFKINFILWLILSTFYVKKKGRFYIKKGTNINMLVFFFISLWFICMGSLWPWQ